VALALLNTVADAVTLTTSSSSYTVDAGSANAFQFTVSRSSCDITSLKYLGQEVQYQGGSYSQIGSGLGTATVSATTITSTCPPSV
jgi:rhamnogalacturonan endolyase